MPDHNEKMNDLRQKIENQELAKAEYEEIVRQKISIARDDRRPSMSTDQLRKNLSRRSKEIRSQ